MRPELQRLKSLIDRCREPELKRVRSCEVVPDCTNRGDTGLSLDHVHFIASNIIKEGFRPHDAGTGHDIPVLVRGGPLCPVAAKSLLRWRQMVAADDGFPPVLIQEEAKEWFCSLGNGHFSQALNLFRTGSRSIFTGKAFDMGQDQKLREAVQRGVPSIILRADMSVADRRELALLLNSCHDFKWTVDEKGQVDISSTIEHEPTQFEALSKVLDSVALNALVRAELGVALDHSQTAHRSKL